MQFYVYVYLDEDYCPTYVGKGCGARYYAARKIQRPPKERIKLQYFDTEEEAYQQERNLIAFWGRKNIDTNGLLLNVSTGGPGGKSGCTGKLNPMYGKNHTEESKRKMAEKLVGPLNPMYGKKLTAEQIANRSKKRSKKWYVTNSDGKTQTIENLNQFCRDHGLDQGSMYNVARGHRKSCKGWKVQRA